MDEIAKEYDVIVLGTGMSLSSNPAMWGCCPALSRLVPDEAITWSRLLLTVLARQQV